MGIRPRNERLILLKIGLQVLVCTDVLSEGIDVPGSSHTICYDKLRTKDHCVEMKGRARKNGAQFAVLVDKSDLEEQARVKYVRFNEDTVITGELKK